MSEQTPDQPQNPEGTPSDAPGQPDQPTTFEAEHNAAQAGNDDEEKDE